MRSIGTQLIGLRMGSGLAPGLPKALPIPSFFDDPSNADAFDGILLNYLGLDVFTTAQVLFEVYQIRSPGLMPSAELSDRTRSGNRPSPAESHKINIGVLKFEVTYCVFKTPAENARAIIGSILRQTRSLGFKRWGYKARIRNIFIRDLVVCVLSMNKAWSADYIDRQLRHMALPAIAGIRGGHLRVNLKHARTRILFRTRRLINEAKQRAERLTDAGLI